MPKVLYGLIARVFVLLLISFSLVTPVEAASITEQLAELGHPDTRLCPLAATGTGLRKLIVVQMKPHRKRVDDEQEAVEILEIISEALIGANQRYVGFEANRRWQECLDRDPEYLFWRDDEDNWRYMKDTPLKYLSELAADLPVEKQDTPTEAYILFSLGLVEQRLGRIPDSVIRFEAAYQILAAGDDPQGIRTFLLAPLIHYHFGLTGDEATGQAYLTEYAMISEPDMTGQDTYVPLIKPLPFYPEQAFQEGIEGFVMLEFTVTHTGRVADPVIIQSEPAGVFDMEAIEASASFRYIPNVVDGKTVDVPGVRNRITFDIEAARRR